MATKRINCRNCIYYYITWDTRSPHGCRAMNFKARYLPSVVVRRNSGLECQLFHQKPKKK